MKALLATVNYWGSACRVGSHQIAASLLKAGWEVAYISSPISPLHALQGVTPELKDRYRLYQANKFSSVEPHLWPYVPGALMTPLNKPVLRSNWVHRHWQSLSSPSVVSAAREKGFGAVDLLYIDNPMQSFWLDAIQHKASVFRVTDNSMGFSRSAPAVEQMEKELIRRVDLVAYAAGSLASLIEPHGPRERLHLPNGVDYAHFSQADRSLPSDLAAIPKPRAIYVGAMDEWFDYELINRAVREQPTVSFVLIGPAALAKARLRPASNLFILGPRPFAKLPGYLHNADVGIIPFDVAHYGPLVHNVNPLKLYEYMACGLPVVAVRWKELESINSPAVLTGSAEEFISALAAAVRDPGDAEERRRYAAQQDWSRRTDLLLETAGLLEKRPA